MAGGVAKQATPPHQRNQTLDTREQQTSCNLKTKVIVNWEIYLRHQAATGIFLINNLIKIQPQDGIKIIYKIYLLVKVITGNITLA